LVLTEFERLASDTVTEAGGRVVKFIGDEALFTAADPNLGCAMARALVAALREQKTSGNRDEQWPTYLTRSRQSDARW
jgi:class 3 adenylate cyclase